MSEAGTVGAVGSTLRVATYNVRHLRDDADAVVRVIRSLDADVVCIQEPPRHPRHRTRLAQLARDSGMLFTCGGRRAGNNAIFTSLRAGVAAIDEVKFSKHRGLHQRGMALAVLAVGSSRVAVGGVHLGLDADERLLHVTELLDVFERVRADRLVLAGDLNEPPGGPTWKALSGRFADAWPLAPTGEELTFSVDRPRRRIDAVLISRGLDVVGCGARTSEDVLVGSDHRPVVADLTLG
jgi:endonuclease/exonuclease/phosphatase family metal-dependent hydrolase